MAPFKGQNMSNNAYATLEGGEIGVAQAVQAEACGLRPVAEMNPILLKPSGENRSQLIRMGNVATSVDARSYFDQIEDSWDCVRATLDGWSDRCDVLVIEGAGSPVELNLMDRDVANLRPIEYVDGKWILVGDVERGGIFAQVVGTWELLGDDMKARGLGFLANRFRGDPEIFSDAEPHFQERLSLPFLGTLPWRDDLRIEDEDSFSLSASRPVADEPFVAWIRYPRVSQTQDATPWLEDEGVSTRWVTSPEELAGAAAVVLPGSRDTLADLVWLHERGFVEPLRDLAKRGVPVVGICGGYQMLGRSVRNQGDLSATRGEVSGLGLLPMTTRIGDRKTVVRCEALFEGNRWECYEIRMGESDWVGGETRLPLLEARLGSGEMDGVGTQSGSVWGCYLHGLFDSVCMRRRLMDAAGISGIRWDSLDWSERKERRFDAMAKLLDECIDMGPIWSYVTSE